jgi:hypothetical protein
MKLLKNILCFTLTFNLCISFILLIPSKIDAALATQAQIQMSDSRPSQTGVTYTMTFVHGTTGTIKCILVQFAANADMTGGVPTALVTTSAAKGSLSGTGITNANWSLFDGQGGSSANGYLQFENSTGDSITNGNYATASATTITNSSSGSFYAQVTTYSSVSSHTCSTQVDQSNVIALNTVSGVSTTVTVSSTLSFTVTNYGSAVNGSGDTGFVTTTASTIPFGTVAAAATGVGSQTLTVSTNAANGYSLYINDTGSLKDSNNDTIRNQAGTPTAANSFDGSSSQSSLAYTADGNGVTFGSNKWAGLGTASTQYQIALRTSAINSDITHVEYKIEPSNTQPPGTYSTTVVYTAVPSF